MDLHDQRAHLAHTGIRRRGRKGELKIHDEALEGGKEREMMGQEAMQVEGI